MNDGQLSSTTKNLLAAAKADAPNVAARAKMWAGVSQATGAVSVGAATVTTSSGTWVGTGTAATKLVAIGALFGGTLTVGLAAVLLQIGSVPIPSVRATLESPAADRRTLASDSSASRESISTANMVPTAAAMSTTTPPEAYASDRARPHVRPAKPTVPEGLLAREASLVSEARRELGRGDPRSALRAIRAARMLASRQLVPEELAVEELALRALGQSDEANGIDVQLRLQYPESALAR
jgi:hypothetical protein